MICSLSGIGIGCPPSGGERDLWSENISARPLAVYKPAGITEALLEGGKLQNNVHILIYILKIHKLISPHMHVHI